MRVGFIVLVGLFGCSEPAGVLLSPNNNPGAGDAATQFEDASTDAGRFDAGEDWVPGSVFDPEAVHRFDDPTMLFDPIASMGSMQGGAFRMVWTGERYVFVFERNFQGRIDLVMLSLDPEQTAAIDTPAVIAPQPSSWSGSGYDLLAANGGATLVRGLVDDGVFFRRLGPLGEPLGDGVFLPPLRSLLSLIRWNEGFMVTAITADPPKGYVVSEQGELREEFRLVNAQRGFLSATPNGHLNLFWADRRNPPNGTDRVYVSEFDQMLRPVAPPREVYASENAIPVDVGPPGLGRYGVIKDLDDGPLLLDLASGPLVNLGPQDGFNGAFTVFDDTRLRLLVVRERGRAPNGPATSLEIFAHDLSDGRRSEVAKLFDLTEDTYIEHVEVAVRGDSVGVGIATGRSGGQRRLRFMEIRALVPSN